jgi:hypothetical protein
VAVVAAGAGVGFIRRSGAQVMALVVVSNPIS